MCFQVINRSRSELNKPTRYSVRFFRAPGDKLITDRRYNTASLLEMYYGPDSPIGDTIQWNPADPNILQLRLPGGTSIYTRVTRRSANRVSQDRFETSEFYEQVKPSLILSTTMKVNYAYVFVLSVHGFWLSLEIMLILNCKQ